jgi:hypothetical protein
MLITSKIDSLKKLKSQPDFLHYLNLCISSFSLALFINKPNKHFFINLKSISNGGNVMIRNANIINRCSLAKQTN